MSECSQSRNHARAAYLGIAVGDGECVLPGHTDHGGVARVGDRGFMSYTCAQITKPLNIAEVFATQRHAAVGALNIGDGVERLSRLLAQRWQERLDHEIGLLTPRPLALTLPSDGLGRAGATVLEHIQLFLRIRDAERWLDDTFTWARRFSMAYCGLADGAAKRGIKELREKCVIEVVRERRHGRDPNVYRLSTVVLASGLYGRTA